MVDNPMQVSAGLLQGAEHSYATVVAENTQVKEQLLAAEQMYSKVASDLESFQKKYKKAHSELLNVQSQLDAEVKAKTEMYMQYQDKKIMLLSREKGLAEREADFYRQQAEHALRPAVVTPAIGCSES